MELLQVLRSNLLFFTVRPLFLEIVAYFSITNDAVGL
jgi:hypothetical protein